MGFNPETYRLDTQTDLWETLEAAVLAIEDGKSGVFSAVDTSNEARSLALRLHKFRQAYEEQNKEQDTQYRYAGLKISATILSGGCGVSITVSTYNPPKITVLE